MNAATTAPGSPATGWTLAQAPLASALTAAGEAADPVTRQRLLALGWRNGVPLTVIRATSGGARVIALGGARIAIGGPLARQLRVNPAAKAADLSLSTGRRLDGGGWGDQPPGRETTDGAAVPEVVAEPASVTEVAIQPNGAVV